MAAFAQARYSIRLEGTETSGDYAAPDPRLDTGFLNLTVDEGTTIRMAVADPSTTDFNTDQLKGGVNDVRLVAISASGAATVVRTGNAAGTGWPLRAGGWFLADTGTGVSANFSVINDAGAANTLTVHILGT